MWVKWTIERHHFILYACLQSRDSACSHHQRELYTSTSHDSEGRLIVSVQRALLLSPCEHAQKKCGQVRIDGFGFGSVSLVCFSTQLFHLNADYCTFTLFFPTRLRHNSQPWQIFPWAAHLPLLVCPLNAASDEASGMMPVSKSK